MTVRERMLGVYNNKATDKPALGIYQRYLPRGEKEAHFREKGLGLIMYHPTVTMLAPPWHFYDGFISQVKNTEIKIEYFWEGGKKYERRSYITPVGTLYQESEKDSGGIGSEHIRKHYITDIEDYKIMAYIAENTVFSSNRNSITNMMEDLGQGGVMLGRLDRSPYQKCLIELCGPEQFLMDLYTDTDEVESLIEIMAQKLFEAASLSLDSPADVFWQPDNVTVDMTPPNAFEKYCLPFYEKQAKILKQTGKPYFLHIDGKMKPLLNMLENADISGIESVSIPEMGGDLYPDEIIKALPGKVIIPNFPSNLALADKEEISRYTNTLKKQMGSESFMLQVSEDIPPHSWIRVLEALTEAL